MPDSTVPDSTVPDSHVPDLFDVDRPYRLNPSVALRPEPFGALAYHFGNRRLSFLKAPELVELVQGLGEHPSVREALVDVADQRRDAYVRALASLAAADMIVPQ
jgi:mycofactocin biosynthesis protein MftB